MQKNTNRLRISEVLQLPKTATEANKEDLWRKIPVREDEHLTV
jgi:hypothetical protein